VGQTPLVRLNKIIEGLGRHVYVKLEGLNPGGSIKTRAALSMIRDAEARGVLRPGATIVEYTSGNQGIGLALVSAVLGYNCVIVMPACMSEERKRIITAYGAQIVTTDASGDNILAIFERARDEAKRLVTENEGWFMAGQFDNPANPAAHYGGTAEEIIAQMGELPLSAFVAAVGTGGTITGCAQRLRDAYPDAVMVTVEPETAAILSGGVIASHKQQGIGDGFIPGVLDTGAYAHVVRVSDEDAFATAKRLAREEGIFCGISSGSNVWAAVEFAKTLPEGSHVVTICVDLGDRYLSVEDFV